MDQKRKLEILVQADFSAWRKWEGLDDSEDNPTGFGTVRISLFGAIATIRDGKATFLSINQITMGYQYLTKLYDSLPWKEICQFPEDPDFRFLITYRENLIGLKEPLDVFVSQAIESELFVSKSSECYIKLAEAFCLIERDYREEVLKRNGICWKSV
jgi:hypothetical protein